MPLWSLPIVAETWDGFLNDINGFHVQEQHVFAALNGAKSGPVAGRRGRRWNRDDLLWIQGRHRDFIAQAVGRGRRLYSRRPGAVQLRTASAAPDRRRTPVGKEIPGQVPYASNISPAGQELGSIIIIVATDAPLLPQSAQAAGPPRHHGTGENRVHLRQRFRRSVPRFLYRQRRRRCGKAGKIPSRMQRCL